MKNKAVQLDGFSGEFRDIIENLPENQKIGIGGVGGNQLVEPVPQYDYSGGEKVIKGKNNTWIVLGRDRPSHKLSGYGGRGETGCGSLDMVVGRLSSFPISHKKGKELYVDNDFKNDAARVLVVQKTNVDKNFGLADGSVGNSVARSAAVMKADAVRIIGREGIKIVTEYGGENSLGGTVGVVKGIDIIAGNADEDLQPMAKGDNLAECLRSIIKALGDLDGIVDALVNIQSRFNETLTHHFHNSPFFGIPNSPSIMVVQQGIQTSMNMASDVSMSLMNFKNNIAIIKQKYIEFSGPQSIRSRWNNCN